MNLYDIKELLRTIIAESPDQDELQDVFKDNVTLPQLIKKRKKQIVRNSGLLEVIDIEDDESGKFCDTIADIDNLRKHIEKEKTLIKNEDYQQSKLPKPRGVLLVGAPGCGKSESAKAIASILELPIYRLNLGSLLGLPQKSGWLSGPNQSKVPPMSSSFSVFMSNRVRSTVEPRV